MPKAAAEGHSCLLGLLQPSSPPWPFPKCSRLLSVPWDLGCRVLLGPRKPPRHSPADTRMNHVGTGGPRALPLPLSFQAGGNGTRWLGSQTAPRGGADRLGAGGARAPRLVLVWWGQRHSYKKKYCVIIKVSMILPVHKIHLLSKEKWMKSKKS